MKKISFVGDYFKDIKRIEMKKVPLDTPGTFNNIIIVRFKPWWKLKEVFSFDDKETAETLFNDLQNKMNSKGLDEFLESESEEIK